MNKLNKNYKQIKNLDFLGLKALGTNKGAYQDYPNFLNNIP